MATWKCGAFSPPMPVAAYRCTLPYSHNRDHEAWLDGVRVARWSRKEARRATRS